MGKTYGCEVLDEETSYESRDTLQNTYVLMNNEAVPDTPSKVLRKGGLP